MMMKRPPLSAAFLLLLLFVGIGLGCEPRSLAESAYRQGPIEGDFALTDYFTASGFMGDGENRGPLLVTRDSECAPRWPNAEGSCLTFTYRAAEAGWAGVYFQYPANNWGSEPGRDVASAYSRMRFLASASYRVVMPSGGGVGDACKDDCRPGLSCRNSKCEPSHSTPLDGYCLISAECVDGAQCIAQQCKASAEGAEDSPCPRGRDEFCGTGFRCGESKGGFACVTDGPGDVAATCKTRNDCRSGLYCKEESKKKSCQPSTRLGPFRFMVGGIAAVAPNIEYSDEIGVEYSPTAGAPQPVLLPDYERFYIDLSTSEMSSLIGGFMWATAFPNVDTVRANGKTAYLADIDSPVLIHLDDLAFEALATPSAETQP